MKRGMSSCDGRFARNGTAGAGVFRGTAATRRTGRRIRGDRGGLRLQRLAAETAGRVRLPGDGPDPARETIEEEDRPPRRPSPERPPVGQPSAAVGGPTGGRRAPRAAADRAGRRGPADSRRCGKRLGQLRTRTINKIKHLLRKHNLEQEQPTKGLDTKRTRKWLTTLPLGPIDRLEMNLLLAQWKLWDEQIETLEAEIREASGGERDGRRGGDDSRLRGLQQPGVGLADRLDRAVPASGELGELLGTDARLPQLGRGDRSAGLDHETRQRHGAIHPRPVGDARVAARSVDEGVVRPDQAAARVEDRAGGGDASAGDDHLAHGEAQRAVRDGRSAAAETGGPGGVSRDTTRIPKRVLRQSDFRRHGRANE